MKQLSFVSPMADTCRPKSTKIDFNFSDDGQILILGTRKPTQLIGHHWQTTIITKLLSLLTVDQGWYVAPSCRPC